MLLSNLLSGETKIKSLLAFLSNNLLHSCSKFKIPLSHISWSLVLVWLHIMDVPGMSTERTDEYTSLQLEQVDVVVLTCGDDESTRFDGLFLDDLDGVDGGSMSDDEILFQEEVFGLLVVEVYFRNIP
jgi:hypothetical protein